MRKNIYLDNAATTPVDPKVLKVVSDNLRDVFGNASSMHGIGRKANDLISQSRKSVSRVLNCRPEEIIFTGSGTESCNLAILGIARANKKYGKHIITTKIEHHAILRACEYLKKNEGFEIDCLDVKPNGIVDPKVVKKTLRPDTVLVSIMFANNEIGTIQPIKEIGKIIKQTIDNRLSTIARSPVFHSDACQAVGALDINVQNLGVDAMTVNSSKIYGPKGAGCLFVRRDVQICPVMLGGDQERGRRAGTQNSALIAGFAKALEIAEKNKEKESMRLIKLRDYMISEILSKIPNSHLNGDPKLRLPNNVNISFKSVDGEMLVLALDKNGICVSTGSACSATETGPSHVMRAIKNPQDWGNARITMGKFTTKKEIDETIKILQKEIKKFKN